MIKTLTQNKMIITKEQQEAILAKYAKEGRSLDSLAGFINGINATIELMDEIMKQQAKHGTTL